MEKGNYKNKADFLKAYYIKCPHCEYNNEKRRFRQYGTCLNCGKIIDEKTYFMIKMNELIKNNKRKMQ